MNEKRGRVVKMTTYISWIRDDELLDLLEEEDVTPLTFKFLRGDVDDRGVCHGRCSAVE